MVKIKLKNENINHEMNARFNSKTRGACSDLNIKETSSETK